LGTLGVITPLLRSLLGEDGIMDPELAKHLGVRFAFRSLNGPFARDFPDGVFLRPGWNVPAPLQDGVLVGLAPVLSYRKGEAASDTATMVMVAIRVGEVTVWVPGQRLAEAWRVAEDELSRVERALDRALDQEPALVLESGTDPWERVALLVADAGDVCDALGFANPHDQWGQIAEAHGAIHALKEREAEIRLRERKAIGDELAALARGLRADPSAGLLPYALSDIASRLQAGKAVEDPVTINVPEGA
jgi:hypothetical protein